MSGCRELFVDDHDLAHGLAAGQVSDRVAGLGQGEPLGDVGPDLARGINDLAARARAGKLKPDDMTEGTYTVSNNGAFGTLITAPIISPPQIAILSTDGIRKRPVVIEGPEGDAIAIRPVGMLAQTFDHRAVDGAYSGAFLNALKTIIETRDWAKELQG